MVEELGAQERLEAADGGAAAEACDGVDERDRDDLVLLLWLLLWWWWCEGWKRGRGGVEVERKKKTLPPFLLAAINIEKIGFPSFFHFNSFLLTFFCPISTAWRVLKSSRPWWRMTLTSNFIVQACKSGRRMRKESDDDKRLNGNLDVCSFRVRCPSLRWCSLLFDSQRGKTLIQRGRRERTRKPGERESSAKTASYLSLSSPRRA